MISLHLINTKARERKVLEDMDMAENAQDLLHLRSIMGMEKFQGQNLQTSKRAISMMLEGHRMTSLKNLKRLESQAAICTTRELMMRTD